MSSTRTEDGAWEHSLHQSDIAEFDLCGERGRRSYLGITPRTDTDSTILGTAVHAAAAHGMVEKRDHQVPHLSELLGVFDQHLAEALAEPFEWKKYQQPHELYEIGHVQVEAWLRKVEPTVRPMFIEEERRRLIHTDDERTVWLEGTADVVDDLGRVRDWKTGEAKYVPWEKQRYAIQPTVYSYLYQWEYAPPWEFEFVLLRPTGKVDRVTVTRTPGDHAWLKRKTLALVTAIEAELPQWPLNDTGWWCSEKWCGAFADCKGAHVDAGWTKASL